MDESDVIVMTFSVQSYICYKCIRMDGSNCCDDNDILCSFTDLFLLCQNGPKRIEIVCAINRAIMINRLSPIKITYTKRQHLCVCIQYSIVLKTSKFIYCIFKISTTRSFDTDQ